MTSGRAAIGGLAFPGLPAGLDNDYHGVVAAPRASARPALGGVVAIIPNHVCPVVDLYDSMTVLGPDGSTRAWTVDARGRSG